MAETREEIARKVNSIILQAQREGAASLALESILEQPRDGSEPLFVEPDEGVLEACRAVRTIAEVVPSVPDHCRSAIDNVAAGSEVAGVFRQGDVWLCVAVGDGGQLEIHAVLVPH